MILQQVKKYYEIKKGVSIIKIENIDKNFRNPIVNTSIKKEFQFYNPSNSKMQLFGVMYDEKLGCYTRMAQEVAEAVNAETAEMGEGIAYLNKHMSGGRIRFSTTSARLCIQGELFEKFLMRNMSFIGNSGLILYEDFENEPSKYIASIYPDTMDKIEFCRIFNFRENKKRFFTVYFPLYNGLKNIKIGIDSDCEIEEGKPYENIAPIVYYGSSITQGGCCTRADNSYQTIISKWNNIDYINLGFSGSALGEVSMANYISSIKASVFVYDYDANAPSAKYLEETHERFFEIYREKNPNTPVICISRPDYNDDKRLMERRKVVRNTYLHAKAKGDQNVYFINGKTLFGKEDRDICTVDGTHPNDLGFYRMAKRINKTLKNILKEIIQK